jgi:hypothetical protein
MCESERREETMQEQQRESMSDRDRPSKQDHTHTHARLNSSCPEPPRALARQQTHWLRRMYCEPETRWWSVTAHRLHATPQPDHRSA